MTTRVGQWLSHELFLVVFSIFLVLTAGSALSAPYAALVMDARSGEVLYAENADTRLHPASLTKMMTLYIAFEAVERGEITLDTQVSISRLAAAEPPSKLGLKPGQKIALRYLIRAAAIKSGNDAATAIGEAIEGSEAAFARRMNRTAKALGMVNTTFKNAHGLTESGHLSTARDMTVMGRRLFFDYPQYYNIFSRKTADAGVRTVSHTNTRFLSSYRGADGIKTGYTSAAGFNLTASAQHGDKRMIATIFGGTSTAQRNAKMAQLLDMGFGKAPNRAPTNKPSAPVYVADAPSQGAKTIRVSGAVKKSLRPLARPGADQAAPEELLVAMQTGIDAVLAEVQETSAPASAAPASVAPASAAPASAAPASAAIDATEAVAAAVGEIAEETLEIAEAATETDLPNASETVTSEAIAFIAPPPARPSSIAADSSTDTATETAAETAVETAAATAVETATRTARQTTDTTGFAQTTEAQPETLELARAMQADIAGTAAAADGSDQIILAALSPDQPPAEAALEVVSRVSTSGGRGFGINIGKYDSRYQAERILLQTALIEMTTLDEALRKVVPRASGFDANFVGMTQETAELACRRLAARNTECNLLGY